MLRARDRRIQLIRFNQDEFPSCARIRWRNSGELEIYGDDFSLVESDITGAWFRGRPRISGCGHNDHATRFAARESDAYVAGVWDTARWFWMNNPTAALRAESKLWQIRQAQTLGLTVPPTLASNDVAAVQEFMQQQGPLVAKTVAGGRVVINDINYGVFTTTISVEDISDELGIQASPVIFQRHIETQFDVRVTVVGDHVFPARIIVQDRADNDVDWRKSDPKRLRYEAHVLPSELSVKCVELVASMGLTYGALDFVVTPAREHVFLEVNPAGQWGWIERALRMPITDTILNSLRGSHN